MPGNRLALIGLWIVWTLSLSCTALASAPAPTFERRSWNQGDGAPQSAYGVTQDADGVLWFATSTGLYNFDGHHFRRVETVFGHALRSNNLVSVVATGAGIAVGYQFGGVSIFDRAGVRHYTTADGLPSGSVGCLTVDDAGVLYAAGPSGVARLGTSSRDAGAPRHGVAAPAWIAVPGPTAPMGYVHWIGFDAATMWAAIDSGLYARARGVTRFRRVASLPEVAIPSIVQGSLVAYTNDRRLTRFSPDGQAAVLRIGARVDPDSLLFDGPGATVWAWLGTGTALLRQREDGALVPAQTFEGSALPGRMVSRTLLDRENNLWVATLEGVERYRMHRLHTLSLPSTTLELHVGRGLGDDILVTSGNGGPVWRAGADHLKEVPGMRGVSAIHRQHAGSVWLGGTSGLAHLTPHGTRHWPLPAQARKDFGVQGIVTDRAGKLWVSLPRLGLFGVEDGRWTKHPAAVEGGDDTPVVMTTGASGTTYLGYTGGRLAALEATAIRILDAGLADTVGNVLALLEFDGMLLIGGDRGVVLRREGVARPLKPRGARAFLGISGMAFDRHGDLWLHGPDGLFRIPARELARFVAGFGASAETGAETGAQDAVDAEVFNFEDGLRGQVAQIRPLPSLIAGSDGRIHYATSSQVGWIDPAAIRRNARAPTVLIQSVKTGDATRGAAPGMTLAAGTRSLEIGFAATALSIPERVRFRYRLAGVDPDWQQPQYERAARYTNLGPGAYRFQVTAANEDGVWNETGAVLDFRIAPHFWETAWFRLLALLLAAALVLLLYRWRIAAATRRSAENTAARLEERERIARNLHDHLLQGVQALVLNCQAVLTRMQAGTHEEKSLSEALARADRMIEETRDEVMNLRGESAPERLVARLARSVATYGPALRDRIHVESTGPVERLAPQVANEVFYLLQEAIANSVRHAGADRIRVIVEASDTAFEGCVIDDGCGIPPAILKEGKAGHWGLVGMRERAERLGGFLAIDSGRSRGTVVRFAIPGRRAYGE